VIFICSYCHFYVKSIFTVVGLFTIVVAVIVRNTSTTNDLASMLDKEDISDDTRKGISSTKLTTTYFYICVGYIGSRMVNLDFTEYHVI
jgi:predicted benzoate:H+ symporter BenE